MSRSSIIVVTLLAIILVAPASVRATNISVRGTMDSTDCGGGLHTFQGTHTATISEVDPAHQNKTWRLTASLHRCNFFATHLGTKCLLSANTSGASHLTCSTQTDLPCKQTTVKAITKSFVVNHPETDQSHISACYQADDCRNADEGETPSEEDQR